MCIHKHVYTFEKVLEMNMVDNLNFLCNLKALCLVVGRSVAFVRVTVQYGSLIFSFKDVILPFQSEIEKPRGRKKPAITDSEEKLSIDDLNKLGQEQKLRGSQRGRKRPAVVSESDETQWQEEKRLKDDVIESEDEQNSPPKKGRRGRPPKANNGSTPKEEPPAKSSKRSKKKQTPAAAVEEEEEEEERQTENIEQKPKGRQNRTTKRTQQR